MIVVNAGSTTHVGNVRRQNEDSLYVGRRIWAVADGMGGHAAGEVASSLAIRALRECDETEHLRSEDVVAAVARANDLILDHGDEHWTARGMGTTLTGVALALHDDRERLLVFNVGDSRTYRLADGVLERITIDHSETEELVTQGIITPEEARTHPLRNIVTRALGTWTTPVPDIWLLDPMPAERFLICSDGLNSEVEDDHIGRLLAEEPDPQAAADSLVGAALDAGGRDNVTVIVLDLSEAPDQAAHPAE